MTSDRSTSTDWTLITVTYNSVQALETFWCDGPPPGARWVVVDNASTDGSVEVARRLGAEVLPLPANRGFGAANNVAFRRATTPFICFVNPDVRVVGATLDTLAAAAVSTGGLVAPQLIDEDDGSPQANGRGFPFLLDKIRHRLTPNDARVTTRYQRLASEGELRAVCWPWGPPWVDRGRS